MGVLKFPINLSEIPEGLFEDCGNIQTVYIQTVYIPREVASIGNRAFSGCTFLEAAYLRNPGKLTTVGENAFYYCYRLKTVGSTEGIVNLPAVTTVGKESFYFTNKVEEAHFPSLIEAGATAFEHIGDDTAFRVLDCPKLESCTGWYTFGFIVADELYLPSIKHLDMFSFGYSKIGTLRLGPNLQYMGNYCFTDAPEMSRTLYFEGSTPPTFVSYTFFIDWSVNTQLLPLDAIHVPRGCKAAYQNALHAASSAYDAYFSVIIDDL